MVGHRYYNPEWGRWIQPDDVEYLEPDNINGLNLYCYCENDPVNKYDPSGHFAISALIIGAIVGAVIGAGSSIISQGIENNWDWNKVDGWLVLSAAIFGAIDGALAVTGMSIGWSVVSGGLLSGLQSMTEIAITGEEFSWAKVGFSSLLGSLAGFNKFSGFDASDLSGLWKTASSNLLNAKSAKKIAMYNAQKAFVKKSIKSGTIVYVGSSFALSGISNGIDKLGWF